MDTTINARPTKSFFVDMLTRDISVTAAILDLCDNALGRTFALAKLDPASVVLKGPTKARPLKRFYLRLSISASAIIVEDNCGGISIERARNEVFRLGGDVNNSVDTGLSVYGIGMKRAFFKLADHVSLRSSAGREWFDMSFHVHEWKTLGDANWDLHFTRLGTNRRPSNVPANGTRIELKGLLDGPKALIRSKLFHVQLAKRLQFTYSLFVALGLDLRLDGTPVVNVMPELASDQLKPARRNLKSRGVRTVIAAGLRVRQDKQLDPALSGWFIYCNGRLVLEADKTTTTGWGDGIPQWHSKFNAFVGFVFFDSRDSRALPWRTTKQGVVDDAEVFLAAQPEMTLLARPVLEFLSRVYPGEVPAEGVQERQLLDTASPKPLNRVLSINDRVFSVPRAASKNTELISIQ